MALRGWFLDGREYRVVKNAGPLLLLVVTLAACAGAVIRPVVTPPRPESEALLVLPGFGYSRGGERALKALADEVGREGMALFVPTYLSRGGLDESRVNLTRFIAAQFEGYFADGGWLKTAAHANLMAQRLAAGIAKSSSASLPWRGEANEVFPIISKATAARLRAAGAVFHTWEELPSGDEMVRLVTSFETTADEVDRFVALL